MGAIVIVCGGGPTGRDLLRALALADGIGGVTVVAGDDLAIGNRNVFNLPEPVELVRRVEFTYGDEAKAAAAAYFERESEVAQLRDGNRWREERARHMFNLRANADRRRRKQMRGIGRR